MTGCEIARIIRDAVLARCASCEIVTPVDKLHELTDDQRRSLDPGTLVPYGLCPECAGRAFAETIIPI